MGQLKATIEEGTLVRLPDALLAEFMRESSLCCKIYKFAGKVNGTYARMDRAGYRGFRTARWRLRTSCFSAPPPQARPAAIVIAADPTVSAAQPPSFRGKCLMAARKRTASVGDDLD
jgi:hypothetical protein